MTSDFNNASAVSLSSVRCARSSTAAGYGSEPDNSSTSTRVSKPTDTEPFVMLLLNANHTMA